LYDPTIDDRETDEEKKEREKEEAKEKAANEARERTAGMYNPHKSLKDMLGEGKEKNKKADKVPVVIDPRLTKVLRPHQVEGVKVRGIPLPLYFLTDIPSFCTNAPLGCSSRTSTDASWQMRWDWVKPSNALRCCGHC
jgi:hypothetical protein